jgi:hypothetical protein
MHDTLLLEFRHFTNFLLIIVAAVVIADTCYLFTGDWSKESAPAFKQSVTKIFSRKNMCQSKVSISFIAFLLKIASRSSVFAKQPPSTS